MTEKSIAIAEIQRRLDVYDVDSEIRQIVRRASRKLSPVLADIASHYANAAARATPALAPRIDAHRDDLAAAIEGHFAEVLRAEFGEAYRETMDRLVDVERAVGFGARVRTWCFTELCRRLLSRGLGLERLNGGATLAALLRLAMFDIASAIAVHAVKDGAALQRRHVAVDEALADFDQMIQMGGVGVADAAEELVAAAEQAAESVRLSVTDIDAANAEAEMASHVLGEMEKAAGVIADSAREISGAATKGSGRAEQAIREASRTLDAARGLNAAMSEIGSIADTISTIAQQTNLLALNATIEAARAGEHGRGFAVVAGEVKSLATQTALATTAIGQQIEGVRMAAEACVGAIDVIGKTLSELRSDVIATGAGAERQAGLAASLTSAIHQSESSIRSATQASERAAAEVRKIADIVSATQRAAESLGGQTSGIKSDLQRLSATLKAV
jgi:methyl-accepting chemotaxis protein